jgi:hypothetical protein
MRELAELIDQQRSGWHTVKEWLQEAINNYEVLLVTWRKHALIYISFR